MAKPMRKIIQSIFVLLLINVVVGYAAMEMYILYGYTSTIIALVVCILVTLALIGAVFYGNSHTTISKRADTTQGRTDLPGEQREEG